MGSTFVTGQSTWLLLQHRSGTWAPHEPSTVQKIAQITSHFQSSQDTHGERENRGYSTSSQCRAPEDGKSAGAFQG